MDEWAVAEAARFGAMTAKSKGAGVDVVLVSKLLEESCTIPRNRPQKRVEWLLRAALVPRPKPGAAAEGCTVSWKPCFSFCETVTDHLSASVMGQTG